MKRRFAFQFLFWEGAFALAFETWTGPVYLSGVAGELGVSIGLLSLMTAVPAIGAVGQVLSLWAYQRSPSVKNYVLRLAGVARALWLIPVFLAWYWGLRSYFRGEAFPADHWFLATAICAYLSALIGTSSGAAWMSWVREVVPDRFRGRFFGVRHRYTMAAVVLAHTLGFVWVGWRPAGFHLGYALLLICALACAALSTVLLSRVPDVAGDRVVGEKFAWSDLQEPFRNERFRGLLIFGALFNGSIQFAGPYFPYFFTKELHLPMSTVSFWTVLTNLGWFAAAVAWGKRADGGRRLSLPFWIAIHMIALSPAFYVWGSAEWLQRIGPVDYFFNGVFWAGYTLVLTTLILEACPPGRCALYYAVYSACAGLAGACGNLLGGQLVQLLDGVGGFRMLWVFAVALRLGVIWAFHPLLMRGAGESNRHRSSSLPLEEAEEARDAHPA